MPVGSLIDHHGQLMAIKRHMPCLAHCKESRPEQAAFLLLFPESTEVSFP